MEEIRRYIALVESALTEAPRSTVPKAKPGHVILYRGDSQKIKNLSTGKGDAGALFGQGIYLTDNRRVANDYMAKGNSNDVLLRYSGSAKTTRDEVVQLFIRRNLAPYVDAQGNKIASFMGEELPAFVDNPERVARLAHAAEIWKTQYEPTTEVRKQLDNTWVIRKKQHGGVVSVFEIPQTLLDQCLNAEAECPHEVAEVLHNNLVACGDRDTARDLWHAFEHGMPDPETGEVVDEGWAPSFRQLWTSLNGFCPLRVDAEPQIKFRRDLKALGYRGIKYQGGMTMGGGYKHWAYVFWDDNLIRKYQIA